MKKAQLSLLIILGVVVLIAFILVFMLVSGSKAQKLPFESDSAKGFVESCITQTAEDGITLLGKQGGRIILKDYVLAPKFGISYAVKANAKTLPSIPKMEDELSLYIKNNLNFCLEDFDSLKKQGWTVEKGEFSISASINAQDVGIRVSYPLVFSLKDQRISLDAFSVSLPIRLKHIRDSADAIAQFYLSNNSADLRYHNSAGLNTTIFPYKGALIYRFTDESSLIGNKPYEFFFAVN